MKEKYAEGRNRSRATWVEYRDIAQVCREGIRKAKAQLVLKQQGVCRATKRALVSILATKRQHVENVGQVLYVVGGRTNRRHGKR